MFKKPLPPGLHVILGDSAGGIFNRVFGPLRGRLLVERDVLSVGPTPKCRSLEAWEAMRNEFWNGVVPCAPGLPFAELRNLADRARQLQEADYLTLWSGTGLSEQLSIAFTLHLADPESSSPERISIVQYEKLHTRDEEVCGTGILNEQNMSEHPPAVPLSSETHSDYLHLFAALTSDDPTRFERFAGERPSANRWLLRAARLMLRRFPDKHSGLPYWDRILLSETPTQPRKAARVIGDTIGKHWDSDPMGDLSLFHRLLQLGAPHRREPLIQVFGDGKEMRSTEVQLTPFGDEVVAGRQSNYPANPIEDWAAGTKLSSAKGPLWFNDDGRLVREK